MRKLKIKEVLNQNRNLMAIIKTNPTGIFHLLIRTTNTIEQFFGSEFIFCLNYIALT
jgi:hypothetical protein